METSSTLPPPGWRYPADFAACIFDMDGLLIDSEPLWRRAEIAAMARVGVPLDDDLCKETMGLRLDEMVAYWRRRFPWNGVSDAVMGATILDGVMELIATEGAALPGVHELLGRLTRMGVPLGLASSSPLSLIEAVVQKLGLGGLFQVLGTAVEEQKGKPDPAVYLSTAARMGVAPGRCLAFEDSPAGVSAARDAGMTVVAVPSGADPSHLDHAHHLWRSLTEHPW